MSEVNDCRACCGTGCSLGPDGCNGRQHAFIGCSTCPTCKGEGSDPSLPLDYEPCPACHGARAGRSDWMNRYRAGAATADEVRFLVQHVECMWDHVAALEAERDELVRQLNDRAKHCIDWHGSNCPCEMSEGDCSQDPPVNEKVAT